MDTLIAFSLPSNLEWMVTGAGIVLGIVIALVLVRALIRREARKAIEQARRDQRL